MKMKKLFAISLMLFAFVLAPMPASASPPTEVNFTETYSADPLALTVRVAGSNTFISGPTDTDVWEGDFEGVSTQDFVVVNHSVAGFNNYRGLIEFEGSVLDSEGTLVMKTNGKQADGEAFPTDAVWTGHWVIVSGTGDLENLRGQGTFSGPSGFLTFAGKVHFT